MLRTDGVVYCHLFLLIIWCMMPETDDKRCVKEGKMEEEKDNCSDSASLRRAGKILARTEGFHPDPWFVWSTGTRWIELQTMFLSIVMGHSWPKYQSQTTCTRSLTRWENLFQTTNPGTNWYTKCKVEAGKQFKKRGKYIPRKGKTCNKQKVEQFLTLISVSSRCKS